ncbi:hypothetical protein Y032_0623g773 [Ancylostoma ceylanicum]|uniref:Uncharacterized protein n=1 Tax=Ancylostoma ceylanicum TaxID=53326 RepID=A0A016WKW7_9BILA|nr:hypothetical protein Y032_0623g773 [Ancylostoma ceylanicum]
MMFLEPESSEEKLRTYNPFEDLTGGGVMLIGLKSEIKRAFSFFGIAVTIDSFQSLDFTFATNVVNIFSTIGSEIVASMALKRSEEDKLLKSTQFSLSLGVLILAEELM